MQEQIQRLQAKLGNKKNKAKTRASSTDGNEFLGQSPTQKNNTHPSQSIPNDLAIKVQSKNFDFTAKAFIADKKFSVELKHMPKPKQINNTVNSNHLNVKSLGNSKSALQKDAEERKDSNKMKSGTRLLVYSNIYVNIYKCYLECSS